MSIWMTLCWNGIRLEWQLWKLLIFNLCSLTKRRSRNNIRYFKSFNNSQVKKAKEKMLFISISNMPILWKDLLVILLFLLNFQLLENIRANSSKNLSELAGSESKNKAKNRNTQILPGNIKDQWQINIMLCYVNCINK